jgi:hypothetical protein
MLHPVKPMHVFLLQAIKPKRKYTRRKDPAEVSANCRAAVNRLVEHEGQMIPVHEKGRRIAGEQAGCMFGLHIPVQHASVLILHQSVL